MKKHFKKHIFILILLNQFSIFSQDPVVNQLFINSYKLIETARMENGVYLDAVSYNGVDKPASLAANGVGLISLCIADSIYKLTNDHINWEQNALDLVNQTIESFTQFYNNNKTNQKGFFLRYFNYMNGDIESGWGSEFSTIDNAVFTIGLNFCKNHFNENDTLVAKIDFLVNNIDYTSAISSDGQSLYMVLDQLGNGSQVTNSFNEYMLVAYLAKSACSNLDGYSKSISYWNNRYLSALVGPQHSNYWGYELLSDLDNTFISSFIPQFTYYYCHDFKNNPDYMNYFKNARVSDSLWWQLSTPSINQNLWGLGAGENPGGGYSANFIDNNALKIISPQTIAGFLPVYSNGIENLKNIYTENLGSAKYALPSNNSEHVLWRYSLLDTTLRCDYIQLIDFSNMLFGLSTLPEFLGENFFSINNEFKSCLGNASINENDFTVENRLKIFPNPTSKNLNIRFLDQNLDKSTVIIRNSDGKYIEEIDLDLINGQIFINVENLEKGFYFCEIIVNKECINIKFIKN